MSREDLTASGKMFQGMISWFVIYSAGSFAAHLPGNVILNLAILIIGKPESFPSIVKIVESATNGQQG
jgi:hypothetical protein